jgi:alkaline phosphatase
MKTNEYLFSLLVFLFFSACAQKPKKQITPDPLIPMAERPKNIILLIGDGMALAQASAAVYYTNQKSCFERFPVVGFHKSYSSDDLITDSAAGATAFSCGCKTTNGTVGQDSNGVACRTILEFLDAKGWATGMVVTCSATHATPASFIAHREIRAQTDDIALDFLKTPLDCFIGGGEDYFNNRFDGCNLEDTLKKNGYVVRRGDNFKKIPEDGSSPFMYFTAEKEPGTASAGRRYLPEAAEIASNYLLKRSEKGFFLMIEGSQIDWAMHANDKDWFKAEILDFDKTVHKMLDFATQNGETLVIVTGDHECGGLAMAKGSSKKDFKAIFSNKLHTGALVPVYSFGPQAELFNGIYENTAIYDKMMQAILQ